jgi:hypothetical protein
MRRRFCASVAALGLLVSAVAAGFAQADEGRLLATGGATTIEGSAGGGIVPLAVLSGYGTRDGSGGTAAFSRVDVDDYRLDVVAVSWSWRNRIELSLAQQELAIDALGAALGVNESRIKQNIAGLKVRLAGDLVYDALPQISVGVQYKKNEDFFIPAAAGAVDDSDYDVYIAGSRLLLGGFFGRNWLLNGVVRGTRANQLGLVGFGGDLNSSREWLFEGSTAIFLNRHWAVGAEYREKPDNLSFVGEDDWKTLFVAWFPSKQWSLVAAAVDLGDVAGFADQTGWYLSAQGSF